MDAKKRALPNGSCNFGNWFVSDLGWIVKVRNSIILECFFVSDWI